MKLEMSQLISGQQRGCWEGLQSSSALYFVTNCPRSTHRDARGGCVRRSPSDTVAGRVGESFTSCLMLRRSRGLRQPAVSQLLVMGDTDVCLYLPYCPMLG